MEKQPNSPNISNVERAICLVGGGLLTVYGLSRRNKTAMSLAPLASYLMYRGVTGYCHMSAALGAGTEDRQAAPWHRRFKVTHSTTINKPREDVYRFWRSLENLPRFMAHLESVEQHGDRSTWRAKGPAGKTVEWQAEIVEDKPRNRISWRSIEGSQIETQGSVEFFDAPGGRGTEVHVTLYYTPPAGTLGALVARMYGEDPETQIKDDLRRMKALLETGEVPTIAGQPRGRGGRAPIGANMVDRMERHTPAGNPSVAA